jgi:uncharacterized protein (DUF433 family)
MQLDDYFDFETERFDDIGEVRSIRFKGTRIGLEHVIEPYLQGDSPERIFQGFRRTLTLEQVYAAITYFLHNRQSVESYLHHGDEVSEQWERLFKEKYPSGTLIADKLGPRQEAGK